MKQKASLVAGVLISALFLWLAFRHVPLAELVSILASVNPAYLLLLLLVAPLDLALRGLRWQVLLSGFAKLPAAPVLRITAAGFALNNVLPFRLGELSRIALLSGSHKLPFSGVLATLVAERLLDVMTICVIFLLTAPLAPGLEGMAGVTRTAWLLLPALLLAVAGLAWGSHLLSHRDFVKRHPRICSLLEKFSTAMHALRSPRTALKAASFSVVLWMIDGAVFLLGSLALGFEPAVSYGRSLFLMCATALVSVIPAAPGYFGTYEFAVKKITSAWGYADGPSVALAALVHVSLYVVVVVIGLVCLHQSGSSIKSLVAQFCSGKKRDMSSAVAETSC